MSKSKNIHSIILARGGSKGIKGKNLININNKPLLYWSIRSSLQSKFISSTWVSSDDKKILNYAKKCGAKIIIRPKSLSKDNSSSESGWMHSVKEIENKHGLKIDYIVGIQNTSPLRHKNDLDNAIIKFLKFKYDSMFSATPRHDIFFSWKSKSKKLKPNYNFLKRPLRQKMEEILLENGSFYIFNNKKFKRVQNRLFNKIGYFKQDIFSSFQLDDLQDLNLLNILMKSKYIKKKFNLL
tara:strand:- start:337 stop:1053 length:717 start_codon:yes stop_codon:yes gene_type:complete